MNPTQSSPTKQLCVLTSKSRPQCSCKKKKFQSPVVPLLCWNLQQILRFVGPSWLIIEDHLPHCMTQIHQSKAPFPVLLKDFGAYPKYMWPSTVWATLPQSWCMWGIHMYVVWQHEFCDSSVSHFTHTQKKKCYLNCQNPIKWMDDYNLWMDQTIDLHLVGQMWILLRFNQVISTI